MYDVRCTKYDLKACARCAVVAERERSRFLERPAGLGGMQRGEQSHITGIAFQKNSRQRRKIFKSYTVHDVRPT